MNEISTQNDVNIKEKIYGIRGVQVMLDRDLAQLYRVDTKRLNEQVKRNIQRFPQEFMFQLTKEELENWKSQIATSNKEKMGLRRLPYAFTEQGVSMLAGVLKSEIAIEVSIKIIKSFVNMRNFLSQNRDLFQKIEEIEKKQIGYEIKNDEKFEKIFKAIELKSLSPKQGIFYNGQIYDAYIFVTDLIKSATKSILLIDNYVDDTVLTLLSKKKSNISTTIYTKNISKQLELDLQKYNAQYEKIEIKIFADAHDRFLIIDNNEIFHIGASLKDLGKKWFAFSKLEINTFELLLKLKIEDDKAQL